MKSHLAFPHCSGPGVRINLPFPSGPGSPALLGSPRIGGQGPIALSGSEPKAELSSLSNYPTPSPSEAPGPAGATAELFLISSTSVSTHNHPLHSKIPDFSWDPGSEPAHCQLSWVCPSPASISLYLPVCFLLSLGFQAGSYSPALSSRLSPA